MTTRIMARITPRMMARITPRMTTRMMARITPHMTTRMTSCAIGADYAIIVHCDREFHLTVLQRVISCRCAAAVIADGQADSGH